MTESFELNNDALAAMAKEVAAADGPGSPGWDSSTSVTRKVNTAMIDALRANDGQMPEGLGGGPLLILTTTGAKSGLPRSVPLGYFEVDGRLVVGATMGGSTRNPPWYYNLVANPEVQVELNGETFAAEAEVVEGADRDALMGPLAELAPHLPRIDEMVDRVVPVIELKRT